MGLADLVIGISGNIGVGKTTLIKELLSKVHSDKKIRTLNLDNNVDKDLLSQGSFESLNRVFANDDFIFIDEAQRLFSIGIVLKLLVDNYGKTNIYNWIHNTNIR